MESDMQQIALGLRQRDVVVLEALVEQYQYRLVRYLIYLLGRRDGVDDLVQESWLRVLERGSTYDGQSRFEPWLFRVARNIALDAMRKRPMFSLDSNDDGSVRPLSGFCVSGSCLRTPSDAICGQSSGFWSQPCPLTCSDPSYFVMRHPIAATCTHCGMTVSNHQRFCSWCATSQFPPSSTKGPLTANP
jgi:hypothetical protein